MFESSGPGTLAEYLDFAAVVLLGVVSYFLKRTLSSQDAMEKRIREMEIRIGILLDRDRQRRLSDYQRGQSSSADDIMKGD